MNLIGTVLRHYIYDMGLSIMLDNIKANMHVPVLRNDSIAYDQTFPFKCHINVTWGEFKLIENNKVYKTEWLTNCVCLNYFDDEYTIKDEDGNIIKLSEDQVIKIHVFENFDDNQCIEYGNDDWNYCDDNGDIDA